MAGNKKKKKPAANPARGFATTSIASKPRPEVSDSEAKPLADGVSGASAPPSKENAPPSAKSTTGDGHGSATAQQTSEDKPLSPEEFERQLEESELQLLVEKHSQKTKRDAQRQRTRLETDRRLLRSQADLVNAPKWLPPDLVEHILDLIKAEMRFAGSSLSSENVGTGKLPSEEDMIVRLWTLRQTLAAAGFPEARVEAVLKHILDIATNVSSSVKDSIWGLDESLEWLARECPAEELPLYEFKGKPISRDTPTDTPNASRPGTPKPLSLSSGKNKANTRGSKSASPNKKLVMTYDLDIEPEDLIPEYVSARAKHLELSRSVRPTDSEDKTQLEIAKLEAKIKKIESDVLFDKFNADLRWKSEKILVERQLAAAKKEAQAAAEELGSKAEQTPEANADDSVNDEADRIAAEILAQEDEDSDAITGLFASLPQNEVDPNTGKTQTVITAADGTKLVLRDFGKWTGVGPRRVLEDSCRSRDPSVRMTYTVVSEATFASRQSVDIWWTKAQELPHVLPDSDVEVAADATHFTFTMKSVAVSDAKQSEAYISTAALFHIFNGNSKDEKVSLRLPPVWKDLWSEMAEAKKDYMDTQDREAVRSLRTMVRQRQDQELEDGVIAFRGRGAARNSPDSTQNGSLDRSRLNTAGVESLQKIWYDKARGEKFQSMLKFRMQLPMWQFRPQVLAAVDDNQVVIVCGETGCGKSTQVPAFLLEHELSQGRHCKIYCTEPRRISAISLARRVSDELGENKGDLGTNRSLVGYSIRLEANTSRETRLVFATTGIVMRMLEGSNDLREVTHLILDEVHERSIDSDFLLIVLKRLLTKRKDLKVVLMSATVDAERFSAYLGGAPILNVPGRTFPVDVRYLEDAVELTGYRPSDSPEEKMVDLDDDVVEGEGNGPKSEISSSLSAYSPQTRSTLTQLDEYRIDFDLILQLMVRIASDESLAFYSKAILVFLPGIAEIRTLNDMLLGDPRFAKEWLIYPLHSSIATEDQESAFLVPPPGVRKIVLATNIAETGITIPDVTCVIDTGKHREMRFDEKKQLSRLIDTFISRANAKQRRGRAGRVQNGLCFHMFTKYRHDCIMSDQQTPEMLRLSLQDLAIRVKICKIGGIEETLSGALDAPSAKNIRRAIDALVDVRALTTAEELTPLGHQLARLPLDVFLGKLILLGTVFKCLDMSITVAAILSSKSPFSAPWGQRAQADNARMAFRRADSDLLTIYNAYLAWKRVCQANSGGGKEFQFCRKNFLSQQTLANIEDLKGQLLVSLADSGFLSLTEEERRTLARLRFAQGRRRQQNFYEVPRRVNINSENDLISSSVIAWSFYPKLLVRDTPGTKGLRNIGNNQNISLHPSSVNRGFLDIKWLSYYHIMQSKTVYHAHETTAVEPFAIALLCGDVRCDMFSGVIVLDGNRGRFALPDWKTMLVLKVLRTRLRELLTRSFKQPGKLPTAQQEKWLEVWQKLFTQDQRDDGKSSGVSVAVAKA
ncbi:pre-mRNA-splicing factor ATP-dependent RNA helicase PRP22 [Metarhizium brunneum]